MVRLPLIVMLALAASAAVAQPVVGSRAVAPPSLVADGLVMVLAVGVSGDWEPPPGLYWAGVGLDVATLAGGAYLVVEGLSLIRGVDTEGAGPGAELGGVLVVAFFAAGVAIGGVAVAVAGYDLVRVLGGSAPALARVLDPTRRPPTVPIL